MEPLPLELVRLLCLESINPWQRFLHQLKANSKDEASLVESFDKAAQTHLGHIECFRELIKAVEQVYGPELSAQVALHHLTEGYKAVSQAFDKVRELSLPGSAVRRVLFERLLSSSAAIRTHQNRLETLLRSRDIPFNPEEDWERLERELEIITSVMKPEAVELWSEELTK